MRAARLTAFLRRLPRVQAVPEGSGLSRGLSLSQTALEARVACLGAAGVATAAAGAGYCTAAVCEALGKVDLTGDGIAETTAYDTVGDGKVDALDTSGDGEVDTVLVDLYRDTPLRYMGYSNEIGEAFRPIFPRFVVPSYALAILYVLADTADKGRKAHDLSVSASGVADTRRVLEQAADCLVWQLLASVFIPGAVIHQVVHVLGRGIKAVPTLPPLGKSGQSDCRCAIDNHQGHSRSIVRRPAHQGRCWPYVDLNVLGSFLQLEHGARRLLVWPPFRSSSIRSTIWSTTYWIILCERFIRPQRKSK